MGLRQMLYEEGRINGINEGRLKGIDEGIDEGITRGLHRGIKSLLKVKFGEEGLKLMGRIREIKDPAKLDAIMVAIGGGCYGIAADASQGRNDHWPS